MEQYINADTFTMKNLLDPSDEIAMDEGFLVSKAKLYAPREFSPFKFEGSIFYICLEGEVTITLNGTDINLHKYSALAQPAVEIVVNAIRPAGDEAAQVLIIAISKQFFFDLKLDLGEVFSQLRFDKLKSGIVKPYMSLSEDECRVVEGHCRLIRDIYNSSLVEKKTCYTYLMTSAVKILSGVLTSRLKDNSAVKRSVIATPTRSRSAFADFMNLAVENYDKERSIKFYADKMCLTPKYLSKLVKEGCGNSASEIIDNLVIAKAKSLLKHSDLSVKVIAARLNFSNQSSFNKFFKAKTGLPPLKFREQ